MDTKKKSQGLKRETEIAKCPILVQNIEIQKKNKCLNRTEKKSPSVRHLYKEIEIQKKRQLSERNGKKIPSAQHL